MKIFIPEIGTKLTLLQDWNFKLFPEHRNEGAFKRLFNDSDYRVLWKDFAHKTENKIAIWKSYDGRQHSTTYQKITFELTEDRMLIPKTPAMAEWKHEPVTDIILNDLDGRGDIAYYVAFWKNTSLPKGTVLTIDRIYIRKGAGEYSSLSFWALIPGDKKRFRFWAKLDDVNRIECSVGSELEIVNALAEHSKNKKVA